MKTEQREKRESQCRKTYIRDCNFQAGCPRFFLRRWHSNKGLKEWVNHVNIWRGWGREMGWGHSRSVQRAKEMQRAWDTRMSGAFWEGYGDQCSWSSVRKGEATGSWIWFGFLGQRCGFKALDLEHWRLEHLLSAAWHDLTCILKGLC